MLNNQKCLHISLVVMPSYEEFEDTKGVTRIRKSKNDRQHNGHKLKTNTTLSGQLQNQLSKS